MEAITADLETTYARLSRSPDFETAELRAYDTADLLITATADKAADKAADEAASLSAARPGDVVVVGDGHGALTLGAAAVRGVRGIRTYQDPLLGERALAQNASALGLAEAYEAKPLGEELFSGARIVLLRLPRGLDALDEIARAIAEYAAPDVRVFAGDRVKHMTRAQNEVLARYFGSVAAGLGWRKARVLTASEPNRSAAAAAVNTFPKWGSDPDLGFKLAAFGATFGGVKLDHGTRLLLKSLRDDETSLAKAPETVVDLGCGNGVVAAASAHMWPRAHIIASDQSDAAVRATALTVEAAGVRERVTIHRTDGTEQIATASVDLILLNPPFHTGSTVHEGVGQRLIRDCARVLKPGGELRLVYNSHLNYRPLVERVIGESWQLARDKTFTVLAAERR